MQLGRGLKPHFVRQNSKVALLLTITRVGRLRCTCPPLCLRQHCGLIRGAAKKKNRFFLGDLSQICLPTHPPQGFCEIWENERWNLGRKRRFSGQFGGVLKGLDLVWESATPPTHIWERSPKKNRFFFWQLPLNGWGCRDLGKKIFNFDLPWICGAYISCWTWWWHEVCKVGHSLSQEGGPGVTRVGPSEKLVQSSKALTAKCWPDPQYINMHAPILSSELSSSTFHYFSLIVIIISSETQSTFAGEGVLYVRLLPGKW